MSFAAESRERSRPVLPLAGMVDVLFLLLVFFITTSGIRQQEALIAIDPPVSEAPTVGGGPGIVITATADNELVLNGQVMEPSAIAARLSELARQYPDQVVVYRGDQTSDLGLFTRVSDLVAQAGLEMRLATARPIQEID